MLRTLITALLLSLFSQAAWAESIKLNCKSVERGEHVELVLSLEKKLASWKTLPPTEFFDTGAQFAWTTTSSGKGYVSFISFILDKSDLELKMSILTSPTDGESHYYTSYQCVSPLN